MSRFTKYLRKPYVLQSVSQEQGRIHNKKMAGMWKYKSHYSKSEWTANSNANSNVIRCWNAFLAKEMQVKESVKYHFIPIRLTK